MHVMDSRSEGPSLQCIPVVCEFSKVFPDDIPSIPPDRVIDFGIDLISYTHPISIPPYRMALSKLKELKE